MSHWLRKDFRMGGTPCKTHAEEYNGQGLQRGFNNDRARDILSPYFLRRVLHTRKLGTGHTN